MKSHAPELSPSLKEFDTDEPNLLFYDEWLTMTEISRLQHLQDYKTGKDSIAFWKRHSRSKGARSILKEHEERIEAKYRYTRAPSTPQLIPPDPPSAPKINSPRVRVKEETSHSTPLAEPPGINMSHKPQPRNKRDAPTTPPSEPAKMDKRKRPPSSPEQPHLSSKKMRPNHR